MSRQGRGRCSLDLLFRSRRQRSAVLLVGVHARHYIADIESAPQIVFGQRVLRS
jgi:hypothetical protein